MLTESCVMFFSPSRAVLSAILRDEYLTSAVRTADWNICFKFCILEQIIATVLFIRISSINNKRSLLRFQSTTAPTNRGWSACGTTASALQSAQKCQIRNNGNKWYFRYLKDPSNLWYLCYALFLYKNLLQLYEYRGWNLQTFKNTSLRINPSLKLKICKFYSCF